MRKNEWLKNIAPGPLVKRVKKSPKKAETICVSDNKDYAPFPVPLRAVRSLALVGVVRLE